MRVTATRAPQGVVCNGQPSRPAEANGVTVIVQETADEVVRGIITATVYELDSIDTLILDGIDLRRIFPPYSHQVSPLPPLHPLPGSIHGALPADMQSRGPMLDRGGDSERRALPAGAHPDAVRWASLNPYLSPSPNTRFSIQRCIGFGSHWTSLARWIQYVLPRVPHGNVQSISAPPLPSRAH